MSFLIFMAFAALIGLLGFAWLQEAVQKAQLKVIGCDRDRRRAIEKGRDGEKEAAKGAKAKLALNEARDALEAHRASAPPPATEKTGVAFATFGKEEDASAALQALADFGRRPRPRGDVTQPRR